MATEEKLTHQSLGADGAIAADVPERRRTAREVIFEIMRGVLYAAIGVLFGLCGAPFGAYPFGVALLSAADRKVIYIFAGLCASAVAFSESPILFVSAYAAVLLIRVIARLTLDPPKAAWQVRALFSENLLLRMASASLGGFILGLYALMSGGFLYYDLFGALINIIGAPLAVFVFYGIFNQSGAESKLFYAASSAIAAIAVYGARGLAIYGISLSAFLAMCISLYVVGRRGLVAGAFAAVVCGLSHSILYAPVFIFAALMYGALRRVSALFGAMAAFTAGIAWGVYVGGVGAISTLLSALLSAALIVGVLDKLFASDKRERAEVSEDSAETLENPIHAACAVSNEQIAALRVSSLEGELESLQGAFSELSRLFFDIGERMKKPLSADVRQICDSAFDTSCASCRNRSRCWDEHCTDMMAAINSMSAEIHKSGRLPDEHVPETLRRSCERIDDILGEIRHNAARHSAELLLLDKSEIFALDYEAISELIATALQSEAREYERDDALSERLASELSALGEDALSAAVCGKEIRRAVVMLASREAAERHAERIREIASAVAGVDMELRSRVELEGACRCILAPRAAYSIERAYASRRASDEDTYCGDTVNIFSPHGEKLYSLISDGMGSGADAALSSRICAVFMEKMLTAGSSCKTATKMLNGFLRNKGGGSLHECSATLDLLEMDLVRGVARFHKSGAAPSYVFRSGELFKLSSRTLPLGILGEIDSKKLRFELKDGDVIIMVSDGVTQGREECPWLYDLLRKTLDAESIGGTVERILDRAARECDADDISVVALKVSSTSK